MFIGRICDLVKNVVEQLAALYSAEGLVFYTVLYCYCILQYNYVLIA